MKINEFTSIKGENIILVPYKEEHVQKYHNWMKSTELQLLTASEPLTLKEEYDMQKSWAKDEDKCTFIILDREIFKHSNSQVLSMIGDTNIFLINSDEGCKTAEIEIMIAEEEYRRKRRGWEAVLLMLRYGFEKLNIEKYLAKISLENSKSLTMFNKLMFEKESESDIFQEATLSRSVDDAWKTWLLSLTQIYEEVEFRT